MRTGLLAIVLLGGCMVSTSTDEALSVSERAWVEDALPVFQANCAGCHASAAADMPAGAAFLAGETDFEIRLTLLSSGYAELDAPITQSPLVTKGVHAGPALSAEQAAAIMRWLESEGGGI